jgi:uncharacterized protein (DUF433 family)
MGRVRWQDRIAIAPDLQHGDPCIRGTRIPVAMIVELLEDGLSFEEIIRDYYPHIIKEDIRACLEYAKAVVENEEIHVIAEAATA